MHPLLHAILADLDPGDAGWGDVWAILSLTLGAYYCYRSFFVR